MAPGSASRRVLVWLLGGQPSTVLICSAVAGQQVSSPMAGCAAERRSLLLSPVLARRFDSQAMQILLRTHSHPIMACSPISCRSVIQAARPGKWQSKAAAARDYRRCEERRASTSPQSYSLLFPLPLSILFSSSLISAPLSSFYRCSQVQAEQSGFGVFYVICHILKEHLRKPNQLG